MQNPPQKYDVAIIGSGIGGSTLAGILARQGLSVIVFDAVRYSKPYLNWKRRSQNRLAWKKRP